MPESNPGDGEIDDVEEFLREFDRVEYDDTLLGLVGDGYDVNAPGDQAVADFLGAWRDDVRRVPLDRSQFPSAHTARGELPPAPITGGTPSMSVFENAIKIRMVADDQSVSGAAQLASRNLADAAAPGLDASTSGALQEAVTGLENDANVAAQAAGGDDESAIRGAGSVATEAFMAALSLAELAREAIETANQQIQAAKGAADDAVAADQQFRSVCSDVAARHGA